MEGLLTLELPYQVASTSKVKEAEAELTQELLDLKNEVEENEMVHNIHRPLSSVPFPKDVKHFRQERELVIKRAMKVCEARPLQIQADVMMEEFECSSLNDYTPDSLPLLLHQFFVDRVHQLVQSKHLHMLRWKRFCEHTSTLEALYPLYQKRLNQIMSEYNDCLERCERLSEARQAYLLGTKNAVQLITTDDLLIYLRWFVWHQHSVKRFQQLARTIEWLPVTHSDKTTVAACYPIANNENRYFEDTSAPIRSRQGSGILHDGTRRTDTPPAPPVSHNNLLLSTNPSQMSQTLYSAAASGGGIASDEEKLTLPIHNNDLSFLKPHLSYLTHMYAINMNVERIQTASDEMELYGQVIRKFRQVFLRQETLNTFKTYDRVELGLENWGADNSTHALKKDANWLDFIVLRPSKDLVQEKKKVDLRANTRVDELLKSQSAFLSISNPERVQDVYREHAMLVRDQPAIYPHSVKATNGANHTATLWRDIYSNSRLNDGNNNKTTEIDDFDEGESENVDLGNRNRGSSARKRRDSYDYASAAQQLGLDDSDQGTDDRNAIPGAFLSFLMLRHLRLRDLKRTSLSILNYFRSIERTLTINDGGLSTESGNVKHTSPQNHRRSVIDGGLGGGGTLGSHQYLHNSPKDFKLSEVDFMEFSDIDNHDDFYMLDEGRIHVQDQKGYYIVYDQAVKDIRLLEDELLLIATHFIQKDIDCRGKSGRSSTARMKRSKSDLNISAYSHQMVDRFGVLLDLWTHHTAYLECKREVLDGYMEAYQHVFDRDERRRLAQVMTDIMYASPRMDFEAQYFVRCYRLECISLRHQSDITKNFMDQQIDDEREYIHKTCRDGDSHFGLPHLIIPKQLISVNLSRPAIKNVYMLEFHPSLALVSGLPTALKHAYWDCYHLQHPTTVTDCLLLENKLLELTRQQWDVMKKPGASYSPQAQKDIFSDVYVEDPMFMCEIALTLVQQADKSGGTRKSQRDKQIGVINCFSRVLQMMSLRTRLFDSAWEAELLFKTYRKHIADMGMDDWHMFLRFESFEFASHKEHAGRAPPHNVQAYQDTDDLNMDRYTTETIYLGIHELDEGHVGRISFRNRETILHLLRPSGVENLQVVVCAQVVHKNILMTALQLSMACQYAETNEIIRSRPASAVAEVNEGNATNSAMSLVESENKSSSPTTSADTSRRPSRPATRMTMSSAATKASVSGKFNDTITKYKRPQECFISIQLEKASSRDTMLNEYVAKKQTMGMLLKNPEEVEKLKRKLILDHCGRFNVRVSQYSLRSQIISYYNSITALLNQFPDIRDEYFVIGQANEKKDVHDSNIEYDPRDMKNRPRRLLSDDGQRVLNIWFIPHFTEVLGVFRKLDDRIARTALSHYAKIAGVLHDVLHYFCAFSTLGTNTNKKQHNSISATWGGNEGIGSELHELQLLIDHLDISSDPAQVCQLLMLRRDVMFLEYDTAVRHAMRDTFLATKNTAAYNSVTECMHFALHELSNAQHPSIFSTYLNVPEPLESWSPDAKELYPWITFVNEHGTFPVHFGQWQQLQYYIQMCLIGLKDVDRNLANGEILGVSLLMEDVLSMGNTERALRSNVDDDDSILGDLDTPGTLTRPSSVLSLAKPALSRRGSSIMSGRSGSHKRAMSKMDRPLEAFSSLRLFLLLWKRLEICKRQWGKQRLGVDHLDTVVHYQTFCREYRRELLFPVLQSVARIYGQADMYEGLINDTDTLMIPKGASEIEIRMRQLLKILESLEMIMISEVRKKVAKEMNLVQAERTREESALPTDLWKRVVIKESFTINRPHISEDFVDNLLADCDESESEVTFTKEHLNRCLSEMGSKLMTRERQNYDSYTMYYENLLRVHHQMLYQKEQEVKQLTDQVAYLHSHNEVEVQCQLADYSHDLIMEITALRAKVAEMTDNEQRQMEVAKEQLVRDYNDNMQKLLGNSFDLRIRFDTFREHMADNFLTMVKETRSKAFLEIDSVKATKTASTPVPAAVDVDSSELITTRHENNKLTHMLATRKALHKWSQQQYEASKVKTIDSLSKKVDKQGCEYKDLKAYAEKEIMMLRQQQVALRKALQTSEIESAELKKKLDSELKEKEEKKHTAQQQAQSRKQLDAARRVNMEKLAYELDDRDTRLQHMMAEQDKNRRMNGILHEKIDKEVSQIKHQLSHERSLKLDAFQRVDDLQTCVYDYESGLASRPQTTIGKTRMSSAKSGRVSGLGGDKSAVGGGVWPPYISMPHHHRSITPAPDFYGAVPNSLSVDTKKIQRPKTTYGRLRSRIADQLINNLEPIDPHQATTVVKLEEVQSQLKEKVY